MDGSKAMQQGWIQGNATGAPDFAASHFIEPGLTSLVSLQIVAANEKNLTEVC